MRPGRLRCRSCRRCRSRPTTRPRPPRWRWASSCSPTRDCRAAARWLARVATSATWAGPMRMVLSRKDDGNLNARHTPTLYNVGYQTAWYWDGRATTLEGADPGRLARADRRRPGQGHRGDQRRARLPQPVHRRVGRRGHARHHRQVAGRVLPHASSAPIRPGTATRPATATRCPRMPSPARRCLPARAAAAPATRRRTTATARSSTSGWSRARTSPTPAVSTSPSNEADRGAFKTPTLRSVAISAPYFHDGSVATLKDAVRYMAGGGKPDAEQVARHCSPPA